MFALQGFVLASSVMLGLVNGSVPVATLTPPALQPVAVLHEPVLQPVATISLGAEGVPLQPATVTTVASFKLDGQLQ